MPWYETALVLDPQLEEEGLNERVQRYVDMLTENGAQDLRVDRRGVRKLAYDIKGKDNEWRKPSLKVKAEKDAITVFIRLENVERDVGQTELNIIHLDDFRLE